MYSTSLSDLQPSITTPPATLKRLWVAPSTQMPSSTFIYPGAQSERVKPEVRLIGAGWVSDKKTENTALVASYIASINLAAVDLPTPVFTTIPISTSQRFENKDAMISLVL